jgi:hypothetical protein
VDVVTLQAAKAAANAVSVVVDARTFGVKANGPTDGASLTANTAALQAFVTYVITNQVRGQLPKGNININGTINLSTRPLWQILGVGRRITRIRQHADNIPILNLGSDNASLMYGFKFADFSLEYVNTQSSDNTLANPMLFSTMAFGGEFRGIGFENGHYGIRVANGIGGPWGSSWDNLFFGNDLTGGAMDWSLSVNGVPNNHWGRFTVECANMVGPAFKGLRGYNWRIETIEFLSANQGCALMEFAAGASPSIGVLKLEVATFNAGRTLFDFQPNCKADIGQIILVNSSPFVFNVPAGQNLVVVGTGTSTANQSRVTIGAVDVGVFSSSPGAGKALVFGASPNAPIIAGRVDYAAGWALHDVAGTEAGDRITVEELINGRISQDRGDGNVTIALGDPNIQTFGTPFTAVRTITLPSDGGHLFNGLYYEIVLNGAVNGGNTAIIKSANETLLTAAADKISVRFTWRRHVNGALGWVMTHHQSLP